ncbi:hypothetical protein SAMN05443574_103261 [Haloarcula vallismortis]|uniref:Uncharacterized protein n=1 Tax=Haloarcula vallismortis TaxID=28442 RepID=A0A1H2TL72_HALVA|nr:hypothetical protein SAMN05443574_103261 [Haloarcula vallismortis]
MQQETPNGWHVVSETFNYNEFGLAEEHELKTDGMLFLEYIGEEGDS